MSTRTITETACGKFILVGEHAAVYGATAIAIPLKQQLITATTSDNCNQTKINSPTHPVSTKIIVDGNMMPDSINKIVLEAFALLNLKPFDITITVDSHKLPSGAGLGASAAFCVVILKLISKVCNYDITPTQLARHANTLEQHFHGNPSGLDVSVITFNKIISFSKSKGARPINAKEFHFALIDSGTRSSTLEMIKRAEPFFNDENSKQKLQKFEQISLNSIRALETEDTTTLATLMNESKNLLDQAGLIDEHLHKIINSCLNDIKVLAAKPTGACGGGFVVALLEPAEHTQQLARLQSMFGESSVIPVSIS